MTHWKCNDAYVDVVESLKILTPTLAPLIDGIHCFGQGWKVSSQVCPKRDCPVRTHCRSAWQMVQIQAAEEVIPAKEPAVEIKPTKSKLKRSRRKYKDLGRLSDQIVSAFHRTAPYTSVRKVASYHAVSCQDVVIVRLWVDGSRSVLADLIPDLVHLSRHMKLSKIPSSCLYKQRPCTHRVRLKSVEDAEELAKIAMRKFPGE